MKDVLGRTFDFREPPRRVVSLVPSLTETLFALGAGDSVAAITDYCIFPPDLPLPRVGGTKNPRVEEIRALAPDLVHMNLEENLRRHADAIEAFAPVFVTEPKSVEDVAAHIAQLGEIHHHRERAAELVAELHASLASGASSERPAWEGRRSVSDRARFTFACPIWKNPWMWCGGDTYVSHLVDAAGGRNLLGEQTRYPQAELAEVLALKPDILFLPDEPYLFTAKDAAAIHGPRVIGPFPGHLFTWHGVRTIEGLRFLQNVL